MKIIPILILIIICACPIFVFSGSNRKVLRYVEIFCEVREKAACELAKKYNLRICGVGEGLINNINLIGLSFDVNRDITKNEARSLLVNCVNDFLKIINDNEEIRPYLVVYPFDAKHVDVTVFIESPDVNHLFHPYLSVVSAFSGKIKYVTDDPENKYKYKSNEIESFEDAVKILNGEIPIPPSEIK